jgi:hypothetical protein
LGVAPIPERLDDLWRVGRIREEILMSIFRRIKAAIRDFMEQVAIAFFSGPEDL